MKFSALISIYKSEVPEFLDLAFKSIWSDQTLKPNEIVVVEDGPLTEDLYILINKWSEIIGEATFKSLKLSENHGLGYALNRGLELCRNEIVIRVDSDDICFPERFHEQVNFMLINPEIDIVGTWCLNIDASGNIVGKKEFSVDHATIAKFIWACPIVHPTVAFRRSKILETGSYTDTIRRRQDYELWFRALANGLKFANIPKHLLYYRTGDEYYKKNNLKTAITQTKIGLKGLMIVEADFKAYIGVFMPTVRALFPKFIEKNIHRMLSRFDPRTKIKE